MYILKKRVGHHIVHIYLLDDEELIRLELPRLLSPEFFGVDDPPLQLA